MAALTKSQIASSIAETLGISKADANRYLESFAALACSEAKNNGSFTLPGLGKLVLVDRKARQGRNPQTGEVIQIPAKKVVKFRVSKACYPLLRNNKEGSSIVNIIANYAWGAAPFVAHAGAAKAGVLNLTRSLALEWSNDKIRVNAMCPGVVLTDNVKKNLMLDENVVKTFESNIPAGGITDTEKMSQQVLYLCSPAASVITGDMLIADGGEWLVANNFYQIGRNFFSE